MKIQRDFSTPVDTGIRPYVGGRPEDQKGSRKIGKGRVQDREEEGKKNQTHEPANSNVYSNPP